MKQRNIGTESNYLRDVQDIKRQETLRERLRRLLSLTFRISLHLLFYCPVQCAAQRFPTQEAVGTASPSGITTRSSRNAHASTTVAAKATRTDLTLRSPA